MIHAQYGLLETQINEHSTKKSNKLKVNSLKSSQKIRNLSKLKSVHGNQYKPELVWANIILFLLLHISAFYGIYLIVFERKYLLLILSFSFCLCHAQGITAGAHRLWSHRCFKVKLPLKILLVFLQTASFQNSIFVWARDHRLHHKYTDTDADPHNAKRGFFFSHMGWLFVRKHPEVIKKGKSIDLSDITSDPLLMFQHKYYHYLMPICAFILPVFTMQYLTGEKLSHCWAIGGSLRYIYSVHMTWLVNSAAHIFGTKPYDRNIGPVENVIVSHLTCGEGFHNFHHVFPWDYKAAELGHYTFNLTLLVINCFAKIGWAYELKTVSEKLVRLRALRTGDGNWQEKNKPSQLIDNKENLIWGWEDINLPREHKDLADITNK